MEFVSSSGFSIAEKQYEFHVFYNDITEIFPNGCISIYSVINFVFSKGTTCWVWFIKFDKTTIYWEFLYKIELVFSPI